MRDGRVDVGRHGGIVATVKEDIGGVRRGKKEVRLANLPLRSVAALVVDGVLLRLKSNAVAFPGHLKLHRYPLSARQRLEQVCRASFNDGCETDPMQYNVI